MLANANGPSFGGWLPDQYSSLLYSPVSDQSGIFESVVGQKNQQQQQHQQQQQQHQQQQLQQLVVQHTKNDCSNLALSPSFIGGSANVGIGQCPSHAQPSLVPSHPSFHSAPASSSPSSSSSSYPTTIAAAYQTQCQNQLANFVQSAFGIQTAAAAAGVGPTMAAMGGAAAQQTGDRPRVSIKKKPRPVPEEKKDHAYRERRKKNNDSARKSREQRRRKEEETQLRNMELEKENAQLRRELQYALFELNQLRLFVEVSKQKQIA